MAQELQQYLIKQYPKENEGCEWKEFKNLKNDFSGHEKDDVISYVSALANMEGGHLVVGKPTAIHYLAPSVATITWVLIDGQDEKKDYEHFTIPFLLTVDEALAKIRNLNQRILPGGTLFLGRLVICCLH